jgi:hypothetical protein
MRLIQLLGFAVIAACGSAERTDLTDPGLPGDAELATSQVGESFSLSPNGERSIPALGMVVRFVDVPTDHRCPLDVTCVWEGDAEVVVNVEQGGAALTFRLHTPRNLIGPTAAELGSGHRLELLGLEPRPVSNRNTPLDDYRATFRVAAPRE